MIFTRCPACGLRLQENYQETMKLFIQELGVTKTQFAKSLGLSRWAVFQWLNGSSSPSRASLQKIKEVYGRYPGSQAVSATEVDP